MPPVPNSPTTSYLSAIRSPTANGICSGSCDSGWSPLVGKVSRGWDSVNARASAFVRPAPDCIKPPRLERQTVCWGNEVHELATSSAAAWGEARPNSLRPRGAARAAPTRKVLERSGCKPSGVLGVAFLSLSALLVSAALLLGHDVEGQPRAL